MQARRPSCPVVAGYDWPADAVQELRSLAEENAALVEFDLDTARLNRVIEPTPVEFTAERSGVVETGYCILLDDTLRKRRAS